MIHPAQALAVLHRYYGSGKRKNWRPGAISDVLKVLLGALGGAALALLLVGGFAGGRMGGGMGRMMVGGFFGVRLGLLFWVLLVALLVGIIVWIFNTAQRR
jgi:outer membrane lipoprotein SlyB